MLRQIMTTYNEKLVLLLFMKLMAYQFIICYQKTLKFSDIILFSKQPMC